MARRAMTGITEQGDPAGQELGVVTAVADMTGEAVFFHRGMCPQEGPSFFRMAFIAKFVWSVRFHRLVAKPAVLIMAARAFQFSFLNRVMRLLVLLKRDFPVANVAELRFLGFQVLFGPRMNRMAGIAGKARRLMLA